MPTSDAITFQKTPTFKNSTISIPKGHVAHMPGNTKGRVSQRTRTQGEAKKQSWASMALAHLKRFALTKSDELKYYNPRTWFFWRGMIMYFFIFSVVGHWLEIPYCMSMHGLFGIVADDYAVWSDPLYAPYWVYGIGAAAATLFLLPLKFNIVKKRKTMWGGALQFLITATILCAVLETVIGLIINQPNEFGKYPFWDNSVLPLNILDQGWLVNDFFLALVALAYVWLVFPFCQKFMTLIGEKAANRVFVCVLALFAVICVVCYA